MTIRDIVSLATKGFSLDDIRKIHDAENESDLLELVKTGMTLEEAEEMAALAGQQRPADPEPSPADPAPDDDPEENEWKQKYDDLLKKTQKENQRQNNKVGDEEADKRKRLEDMARRFM